MRSNRRYLATVLAFAGAIAFGMAIGPYWALDAVFLAVLSLGLMVYFLPRFDPFSALGALYARTLLSRMTFLSGRAPRLTSAAAPEEQERYPTSRIVHYVRMSKMTDPKFALSQADGPFERALLKNQGWQNLTEPELREVARLETTARRRVASGN